jgi:hypothetical protein
MTETVRTRRQRVVALLWTAIVAAALLCPAVASAKRPAETPAEANAFLDRFVGHWIGEGTANGSPIGDDLGCERVLDGTFLFMRDAAIGGKFRAESYVGYSVESQRYELYTFNNNTTLGSSLPVRHMTGQRDGDRLVLEEKPGPNALRYTYEFVDRDTFRLTKAFLGKKGPAFVTVVFRRK